MINIKIKVTSMKNKYIEFCDLYSIQDGVLREMLIHGKKKEALKDVDLAIKRRLDQVNNLKELKELLLLKEK